MSGIRLVIGTFVMGIVVPVILFFLLELHSWTQLFAVAATCLLAWGAADLFATILEKPRLRGRSPGQAIREDLERRVNE